MAIDDFLESGYDTYEYPDMEMLGISEEIEGLNEEVLNELELMGIDINDPEIMGGWLKKLVKKIKTRVREKRARRAESKARGELPPEEDYSLSTPIGTVKAGAGGVSFTQPQTRAIATAQQQVSPLQNPLEAIKQNPMLLAIPIGLIALLMLGRK